MTDKEKIRAEIERRITDNTFGAKLELIDILAFLDTISEEPTPKESDDLKEAAEEYECNLGYYECVNQWPSVAFKAGAEWQKKKFEAEYELDWITDLKKDLYELGRKDEREQMRKDAVEGYVNYYEDSGGILMAEALVGCPYHNGDKVKIIIIKDDENIND